MQGAAFWAGLAALGALWWGAVVEGLGRLPDPVLFQVGASVLVLWAGQEWYWHFCGVKRGSRR